MTATQPQLAPTFTLVTTVLPGPTRKRTPAPYHYRITFRSSNPMEIGCVATCEVLGGRETYQLSLERTERGDLRWHCTCADAVYRDDGRHIHRCKHVQGLAEVVETFGIATSPNRRSA